LCLIYARIERHSGNGRGKVKKKVNCWWMNGWRWWWCDKQAGGSVVVWGHSFQCIRMYVYEYMWVCVFVLLVRTQMKQCVREREKLQENIEMQITVVPFFFLSCHYPLPFSPQFPLSLTVQLPQRTQLFRPVFSFFFIHLISHSTHSNGVQEKKERDMLVWFGSWLWLVTHKQYT